MADPNPAMHVDGKEDKRMKRMKRIITCKATEG